MVVSINSAEIQWKVMTSRKVKEVREEARRANSGNALNIAYGAGEMCVRCIENALHTSGASGNMIYAVGDIWSASPEEVRPGLYRVFVYIDENSRSSLVPGKQLNDMAALVNKGYSGVAHRIRGMWHGKEILNMPSLAGTNFVQQGVSDFNGNYGSFYDGSVYQYAEIISDRFT